MAKIRMKERGQSKVWVVWENWHTQVGSVRVFHAANEIYEGWMLKILRMIMNLNGMNQ